MELKISSVIKTTIEKVFGIELSEIKLETPPKKELGDFAFGCFVLAKDLQRSPIIIAQELAKNLEGLEIIESAKVAGPYINIKVSKNNYTSIFNTIYNNKEEFLNKKIGEGKTIVVDYIGANVGKILHIGHMCTPNQGQVMINLYKRLGYNVISDSHIGDWGIIFGKLILAYKLWGDETKLKDNAVSYLHELYIKITAETKDNEALEQQTRDEFKLLAEGNKESIILWEKITKYSIDAMNIQLARLNIKPDFNIGESFYEGLGLPKIENYPDLKWDMKFVVKELIEKNIATKNDDNSVGVIFDDSEKIPSCILQKRDGTHGYLASDLAGIKYRIDNWNPEKIIYFVDVRQQLHLRQAFLIAKNSGWLNLPQPYSQRDGVVTELFHAYNGFISLKDGAMSSRLGNIIKLEDLLNEAEIRAEKIILEKRDDISGKELKELKKIIGIGAIKYGYLKKSRETDVIFDWDEFMTFDGNSGPYIQYAYVRAIRILEKYGKEIEKKDIGNFENPEEIDLLKLLQNYNDVKLKTSETNSPHILCKYSYELTKSFNSFYNSIHILNETEEGKKIIRLKLINLFTIVLKDCFEILGIDMPEKM